MVNGIVSEVSHSQSLFFLSLPLLTVVTLLNVSSYGLFLLRFLLSFISFNVASSQFYSRKEVFQPHLPVRLPCYDLAPVIGFTLGRSLRLHTLGTPNFHGLTGGVYKARNVFTASLLIRDY